MATGNGRTRKPKAQPARVGTHKELNEDFGHITKGTVLRVAAPHDEDGAIYEYMDKTQVIDPDGNQSEQPVRRMIRLSDAEAAKLLVPTKKTTSLPKGEPEQDEA